MEEESLMENPPLPTFISDNAGPIADEIVNAIVAENRGAASSYGRDSTTRRAQHMLQRTFGPFDAAYFTFCGTGANVVALAAMVPRAGTVIAANSSHIISDERRAHERFHGIKFITVTTQDGKLTPDDVRHVLSPFTAKRLGRPSMITVSQPTEYGELYTLDELRRLCSTAHDYDVRVHVDGARLANAAAALRCSLRECTADLGIDALTFGGTKNGLQYGEVILFFSGAPGDGAATSLEAMQRASKMRFIAAQFIALLDGGLWYRYAEHANGMARYLANALAKIPGVRLTRRIETNAVFTSLPGSALARLREAYDFYVFDSAVREARWMTHSGTRRDDADALAAAVEDALIDRGTPDGRSVVANAR
jgi:threonine aldolase